MMQPGIISLEPYQLILASSSPRRRELLGHLGLPFSVIVPDIEEKRKPEESIRAYVQRNARDKAIAVLQQHQSQKPSLVIGSDTVGLLHDTLLEKPADADDARKMLSLMSGQTHEVLTAIALARMSSEGPQVWQQLVVTKVKFKVLNKREIDYYVSTGEPLDKAGSYGIQGIGGFMVEGIEGSYSNVVGLPLVELIALLSSAKQS